MKKILLIVFSFLILGFVFFYSEERNEEGVQEVKYWTINPDEIRYFSPKNSSEFSKFISTNLRFEKKETGFKSNPFFLVRGKQQEVKEDYLYEANYNVKNLFSEISILSTKTIVTANDDLLKKFQISLENSPSLEIVKSSTVENKIYIGEENRDKSRRYAFIGKDLITISSHIPNKFQETTFNLRNRNYIRVGELELTRVVVLGDGIRLTLENVPEAKNNINSSKWFKIQNGKFRIDPATSGNLYPYLQTFKADLYPDETDGEGFPVARELVKSETLVQIDFFLTNGLKYKIKLFPKVVLKNKTYYPVLREVENYFTESPTYTSEELVIKLLDLFKKIQSEPEWKEPKGK